MNKPTVDVLVVALGSPILVGVYNKQKLIKKIETTQKTSDVLDTIFKDIFEQFEITGLFFAKGPGSLMAIKLVYIFLKTISMIKNIKLCATDGFSFTDGKYIKAHGRYYFVKENGEIKLELKSDLVDVKFNLPDMLDYSLFSNDTIPLYAIPAV